ncbi:hypothetical protein EES45_36085 [Streptomyces sp. ADI97-07]|uniref:hypothetical protein n=1 Tax=Streptomyces sp. ADI97-07 TaxID=1522762 RepID=UPI000F55262F|nr:hypothetical protein [Streptomyces sp. ADI97-07]RPK70060.1 hypothetical protein EES45_36085 [Streptomyces sp. ADI97-07]
MSTHPVGSTPVSAQRVALRYALMPVDGNGIAVATVARMLDDGADGARARVLAPGEQVPYGVAPVLVADTTLHAAVRVQEALLRWGPLPRPWLVLMADAPARAVQDARFLLRALESRLAGVARVPYLPVLRAVKGADEALEYKDVRAAAERLRRTMEGN